MGIQKFSSRLFKKFRSVILEKVNRNRRTKLTKTIRFQNKKIMTRETVPIELEAKESKEANAGKNEVKTIIHLFK